MSDIVKLIGNTPLVRLDKINPNPHVKLFAKLEGQNPAGSVKDRPAYSMVKRAIKRGAVRAGMKLVEATSGNTGIALAMVAQQLDLSIELVMPEGSTAERVQTMKAFGATVILTPREQGIEGSIDVAGNKVESGGYYMLDQFSNPDNPRAHYETTGPEIWKDTKGAITHFISAMGTTGTIMGTSRYLKEQNPAVQIIGVQPAEGSQIPGIRKWPYDYVPKIYQPERVDRLLPVTKEQAVEKSRRLTVEEGIFAGMSSGGAIHVALEVIRELESGVVVCIICDRGDRYLSSDLFQV